ncbi:MAG: transcription factor S [Nitrososphaerota archaeon]|nr:transcription factor S [Nitrososphaerota archaeon]
MDFCPKCGSRLKPKQLKEEESVTVALACLRCDYTSQAAGNRVSVSEEMEGGTSIKVVGEEADALKAMPVTTVECPKCHNMEAQWWFVQTRSGDEPPTQFYRCTKCDHTWRQYA